MLPGPLSPVGVPSARSRRGRFDDLVLGVVQEIEERWHRELGLVEFAVEEIPWVPEDWSAELEEIAERVVAPLQN